MLFAFKLSLMLTLNLLIILVIFIVHVACRVNKKFGNTKKSVNLFANHKRLTYIWMKYICATKYIYIYCFTINKYTSFLITELTTDHWSKP